MMSLDPEGQRSCHMKLNWALDKFARTSPSRLIPAMDNESHDHLLFQPHPGHSVIKVKSIAELTMFLQQKYVD